MTFEEKKYTLEEARLELSRQECILHGHDYEFIFVFQHDGPVNIVCGNGCGRSWRVEEIEHH